MRLALLVLVSCSSAPPPTTPVAPVAATSNVLRGDYAGSSACGDCHAQLYASWAASPMRNMTRDAATATIRAPFDGAVLHVGPDTATMVMEHGQRVMKVVSTKDGTHTWRVTKVVGGRYREDFVGVAEGEAIEHVLPATYVFATKSWRYKGYSVMVKERPYMSVRGQWSQECIGCHNTLPLATTLYDELYGPGLPAYQGKLSDRILPRSKQWGALARDEGALVGYLESEIDFMGGDRPPHELRPALAAAATTSEQRLDGTHLVELGIGCEACHNGSKRHAQRPEAKPDFAAVSDVLTVVPPPGQTGTRAQWINHTCAKCHTVLFTKYPWTWEGGLRSKDPGGSSISSGEGRDYQLGGCASQMACTTCHDPHAQDQDLDALATKAGDHLCMTCHAKVEEHSHHASVGCISCHMPKKNMGLDYGMIRYHRIGSPNDPKRVERDRPVECALCHADRSVDQLVGTMEAWWPKRFDREKLRGLYGDTSANALRATLVKGKPHEQAVAISVYGALRDQDAVAAIAPMLAHDYPLVRYFAQRALQAITGDPVAIDVGAAAATVRAAADAWLRAR